MFISRLFTEYGQYHQTQDYVHGVLVEITGIALEVILLSIAIPIILYVIRRIRTRPLRATFDFYIFQIFHKLTGTFLHMASITDVRPILMQEMENDPSFEVYGHAIYGNLENKLFVLKRALENPDAFQNEVKKRTLNDFKQYQNTAKQCMEEIDRISAIFVTMPDIQKMIIALRGLIYPLRDLTDDVVKNLQSQKKKPSCDFLYSFKLQGYARKVTGVISTIFAKRRKLIDSTIKRHQWQDPLKFLIIAALKFCYEFIKDPFRYFGKLGTPDQRECLVNDFVYQYEYSIDEYDKSFFRIFIDFGGKHLRALQSFLYQDKGMKEIFVIGKRGDPFQWQYHYIYSDLILESEGKYIMREHTKETISAFYRFIKSKM